MPDAPGQPDNTAAALALVDSLLPPGAWAVEATCYRSGKLVALRLRRLRPDEQPGQPPATERNERGLLVRTYYPRAEE